MSALFACSRCFTRHPFEELSQSQQLCKECRGAFPVVKCTYCRAEFQQEKESISKYNLDSSKGSVSSTCKRCEENVKQYGKPSACEYCSIIAAFVGSKCHRCRGLQRKYGPPKTCMQCKQRCAFDTGNPEDRKKVDGKLLCWLCTLSYKRALAKTKQTDPARHSHVKLPSQNKSKTSKENSGRRHSGNRESRKRDAASLRVDVTKLPPAEEDTPAVAPSPAKAKRIEPTTDPNSPDHIVVLTELREQVATLQRQLAGKDSQLLQKDKQINELKANHFSLEQNLRRKMKDIQSQHDIKVDSMQQRIKDLTKQVAQLSKQRKSVVGGRTIDGVGTNSGSGTDSPSTQ